MSALSWKAVLRCVVCGDAASALSYMLVNDVHGADVQTHGWNFVVLLLQALWLMAAKTWQADNVNIADPPAEEIALQLQAQSLPLGANHIAAFDDNWLLSVSIEASC